MKRAEHIFTFAQTCAGGGVERAQLRLAAGWLAAGRRVTMVLGTSSGPLVAELPPGLEIVELGTARYPRLLLAVPGHVRRLRPDAVFCPGNHYTSTAAAIRLRLRRAAPPIITKLSNALSRMHPQGSLAPAHLAWNRLHPYFLDHVVALTLAMRDECVREMKMPPDRVSIIANPPARPIPDALQPVLPSGRFVLGVGRLVPQKRWDRAIAALPTLADRDIALVILGEGECRHELEAHVRRLGLGRRVFLPGYAPDPLPAIARASAVVLTSDFEGSPGILHEALAQGTPVVATEASVAVREIVARPEHGTVVPIDDERALTAALDDWLVPGRARPEPVPQPGENAVDDYLALFDRLVAEARTRRRDAPRNGLRQPAKRIYNARPHFDATAVTRNPHDLDLG